MLIMAFLFSANHSTLTHICCIKNEQLLYVLFLYLFDNEIFILVAS